MIICIVAADNMNGIATETGIPWKLSIDQKYFRDKIAHKNVVMGYNTYAELSKPLTTKQNVVLTHRKEQLRSGFSRIEDKADIVRSNETWWIIGGASVYSQFIDYAEKLYITQIDGDFNCTKFFPGYKGSFEKINESKGSEENGITFYFTVWKRIVYRQNL